MGPCMWPLQDSWPQSAMTTFSRVAPLELPTASMALTTSMPLVTLPNTTCCRRKGKAGV